MVTAMDVDMPDASATASKDKLVATQEPLDHHLPWVEKYRPRILEDLISQNDIISTLKKLVDENTLPNLLFYGPPGTGKTSTILAIAKQMYGASYKAMVLELNASDDRGIDVVREQIKNFASTRQLSSRGHKMIILDEADAMTQAAQAALRRVMEKYTMYVRFCLICNYASKIIPALQSRCTRFRFAPLNLEQIVPRLRHIVEQEGVLLTDSGMEALLKLSEGDMRRVLNVLQACHSAYTTVDENAVYACTGQPHPADTARVFQVMMNDEFSMAFTTLRSLQVEKGLAVMDMITALSEFQENYELPPAARVYLLDQFAEIEYRLAGGGDDKIQLLALLGAFKLAVDLAAKG